MHLDKISRRLRLVRFENLTALSDDEGAPAGHKTATTLPPRTINVVSQPLQSFNGTVGGQFSNTDMQLCVVSSVAPPPHSTDLLGSGF